MRDGNAWRFATEQGVEEILNRRIGANERSAIAVLRAYVDAQHEYASVDRDGDGVLQFAQKLAQRAGQVRRPVLARRREQGRGAEPVRAADRRELGRTSPGTSSAIPIAAITSAS